MNTIRFWLRNARPISLPQSIIPAVTALCLSFGEQHFSWIAAFASLFGVVFLHLSLNLLDDWFDHRLGSAQARQMVANEGFRGRMVKYPYLTSGQATPTQLLRVVLVLLGMAAAMGMIVFLVRGIAVFGWILTALVIGVSYSGGPLKLGFRGLGELVIFLMFGPLLMTGVYFAVTGSVSSKILWLSSAVGLLVTNIVYSHSVLDAIPDQKMGKKTMAHLMGGPKGQIALSAFINAVPYLLVLAAVLLGQLHWAYLLVLLVFPVSMWLVGSLYHFVNHQEVPIVIRPWMGPMGDFESYRKAGIDWFLLRWLVARNIVMMYCIILIVVNFIVG